MLEPFCNHARVLCRQQGRVYMARQEFFFYVLLVLVLLLSGANQFRGSRLIGIAIIVIALVIGLEVTVMLGWVQLPNVLP